tara:strand:- start:81994 stop:82929 length:936 start_codon:yes stop_codon:yes gene_type:complete
VFEYNIQKAWEQYKLDYGLGRNLLLISCYNLFLFFLSITTLGGMRMEALYPIYVAFLFYFLRSKILKLGDAYKLGLSIIPLLMAVLLNYYLIGEFDRAVGFERKDALFSPFDEWLFGMPIAKWGEELLSPLGLVRSIFYDLLMLSYMSYFLLPVIGSILIHRDLPREKKYKIGRFFVSVLLFFFINYLFYLLVPVTGPQYWMPDIYTEPLPFTPFGHYLWGLINQGQSTFIDCFPSGHTGVALLVTLWLFKTNHRARFILLGTTSFIIMATLLLRYHYIMDLICALPLAFFSLKISWTIIPESLDERDLRR